MVFQEDEKLLIRINTIFENRYESKLCLELATGNLKQISFGQLYYAYKILDEYKQTKYRKIPSLLNQKQETSQEYLSEYQEFAKSILIAYNASLNTAALYVNNNSEVNRNKNINSLKRLNQQYYSDEEQKLPKTIDKLLDMLNISWGSLSNHDKITFSDNYQNMASHMVQILRDYVLKYYDNENLTKMLNSSPNYFRDARDNCLLNATLNLYKIKNNSFNKIDYLEIKELIINLADLWNFNEIFMASDLDKILGHK